MQSKAERHIRLGYPKLSKVFEDLGPLIISPRKDVPVGEAITRIVIGQMLSRSAADTVYARVKAIRKENGLAGSWELEEKLLLSAGLSRRKARTVKEFGKQYNSSPHIFEGWRNLNYYSLLKEVSSFWGLSTWSADMLAIFYFGHRNVFPETDGTIKRATLLIEKNILNGAPFDPIKARPYMTQVALYLWKIVDANYFGD